MFVADKYCCPNVAGPFVDMLKSDPGLMLLMFTFHFCSVFSCIHFRLALWKAATVGINVASHDSNTFNTQCV